MFFKKKEDATQRELLIQYKVAFGTREGRAVLLDLMNRNFILQDHKGDPYAEGRRAAVLDILNKAHIDIKSYDELLRGIENE